MAPIALADTANLVVQLRLDDRLSPGLGRVSGSLSRFQGGLSQMGKGLGQVTSGLDRLATRAAIGAAAGLAAVVTTAASFEQAFTGVEKTVDGTDAQLAELEQTLRSMARTIPVTFEELSAIGEAGGALGVARESLDEFIDVVARLSVSTNLSSDAAATALGQLGTILHLTEGDYEDFADSLVALGNAGASTEDQIVELAARFAAAGNSAGLTKEEILAISSAVASMGIEVEAGGTALSATFNGITQAIGTSSDEVNAFTKTMGISAAEFKRRWTDDALGTFQAFLGELAKLDQYEQSAILEEAGITGIRQLNAVKLMTQNLGFFGDQLDVSRNAQGALDKESQKFFDTTAGQWKVLTNNVRDAAATIGTELLPVTNILIRDFVDKLNQPGTQATLRAFGTDLAAGIKGLVSELKGTDFSGIIGGMKIAAQVAKGAFDAFRALPAPIQQLAIAALIANKVSGGAVGQIAKGLGNLVLGSLKTIHAAQVTVIGGSVTGGGAGVPVAGGGGVLGGITKFLGLTSAIGLGAVIGNEIGRNLFFNPTVAPAVEYETSQFNKLLASNDTSKLQSGLAAINDGLRELGGDTALGNLLFGEQIRVLKDQKSVLQERISRLIQVETTHTSLLEGSRATSADLARLAREELRTNTFVALQTATIARLTGATIEPLRLTALQTGNAARMTARTLEPLWVTARKRTSFVANITTNVSARLSVTQSLYTQTLYNSIKGDNLLDRL